MRKKILTVTADDCELQTFRAGGHGGQNQNKRDTGVRWIHHPSGARGESREHRTQWQNKKAAWKRMANTPQFKYWVAVQTKQVESEEKYLERMMKPENLREEHRIDGKWEVVDGS
jgi:protein subunit release factor B